MIVCADKSLNDFYVIVHEMGHIQYYMAFEKQPTVFQVDMLYVFEKFYTYEFSYFSIANMLVLILLIYII